MKKFLNIKRVVAIIAVLSVTVCGSIFFILYADSGIEEKVEKTTEHSEYAADTVNVITPANYCSYGELMFAYIGKDNYIYNLDNDKTPLIKDPASTLLYASDDSVLYTSSIESDYSHKGREYVIRELQIGEKENTLNTISTVSIAPCWSSNDEVIYYVEDSDRRLLKTFEPLTSSVENAAKFKERIMGLRISSDGLLVTLESGEEELFVPLSKSLTHTHFDSRKSIIKVCEQYDLIISHNGELFYRWIGSPEAKKISNNVITAQGYQDNEIFYTKRTGEGSALYVHQVSEGNNKKLCDIPENILPQLTVSAEYAFVIDENYNVYRYDIDNKKSELFTRLSPEIISPMISVFDYRLMVYDLARELNDNFVCEYKDNKIYRKIFSDKNNGSRLSALSMGAVGENVESLQNQLCRHGYLKTTPSGIFDYTTMLSLKYLQSDIGVPQTGFVNKDCEEILNSEEFGNYKDYVPLSVTSVGIRVRDVNDRLLSLGYLQAPEKEKITQNTIQALNNFSKENGLKKRSELYRKDFLKKLFSKNALEYKGYFKLEYNKSEGKAVANLNQRLKELGYLSGSVNPSYDKKTRRAVKLYQEVNKINNENFVSVEFQKGLFSSSAKKCPKNKAPAQILDTSSANIGQVISDRQLKIMRKWLTKQFAINHTDKQAVKRLQKKLERLGYLRSEDITMIYDQKTFGAVKKLQKSKNIIADGIASKDTLTSIFSADIAK